MSGHYNSCKFNTLNHTNFESNVCNNSANIDLSFSFHYSWEIGTNDPLTLNHINLIKLDHTGSGLWEHQLCQWQAHDISMGMLSIGCLGLQSWKGSYVLKCIFLNGYLTSLLKTHLDIYSAIFFLLKIILKTTYRDFPGSSVVKTPCFQYQGHGFYPCSVN